MPFNPYQGPALYAHNNAQFTKDDWKGIRMLCDSIKVKDPLKVGRFGLGFKSVFHVTGKMGSQGSDERQQQMCFSPTHLLTHSPTHPLTHSPTRSLTHSLTHSFFHLFIH